MINQITQNVRQLNFKNFSSCVYLVKLPEPILIDTGSREAREELVADLKNLFIEPEDVNSIILTHNHWDHNGNLEVFKNAKIYSSINIKELKSKFPEFKTFETPGHTRDSICILYENILFSGDTIFDKNQNYVGRTDMPESLPEEMPNTLEKLKNINYEILCPGHLV